MHVWHPSTGCQISFMGYAPKLCAYEVRENIDRIDNEIVKLIAERGTYIIQASNFKKDEDGVKNTARVEKVIQKVRTKAQEYGADQDMIEALYREMISRFVSMEMKEFQGKKEE